VVRHLDAWERAVDLAPYQPDRWYEMGDVYFHDGPYLQIESSRRRAADAFRRSVAIDSGTGPLGHLLEIAVMDGDTAAVRRLGALYVAHDSSGELLDFYRWRIAQGLHDDRALTALRAQYGQMSLQSTWRIMNYAVLDGVRLEDAESAAAAIRANAGRSSDWQRSKTYLHAYEVNRGRPVRRPRFCRGGRNPAAAGHLKVHPEPDAERQPHRVVEDGIRAAVAVDCTEGAHSDRERRPPVEKVVDLGVELQVTDGRNRGNTIGNVQIEQEVAADRVVRQLVQPQSSGIRVVRVVGSDAKVVHDAAADEAHAGRRTPRALRIRRCE